MKTPLDHNLAQLLTRAYEPARPGAEFRQQLLDQVLERIPEPRRSPAPRAWTGPIFQGLAAALLMLVLLTGWERMRDVGSFDSDGRVPAGVIALRVDEGSWFAATTDTVPWLSGKLEAVVPDSASSEALSVVALTGDRVWLGPGARARLQARPEGPVFQLDSGQAHLEKTVHSPRWRVLAGGGAIDWEAGRLELASANRPGAVDLRVAGGYGSFSGGAGELSDGVSGSLIAGRWQPDSETLASAEGNSSGSRTTLTGGPGAPPQAGIPEASEGEVLEPGQPTGGVIRGRVASVLHDSPLERFRVWTRREVNLPAVTEPACHVFEDSGGDFLIEGLDPGRYSIVVEALGHAAWRTVRAKVGVDELVLEVELGSGGTLRGFVNDARTDTPLVGALVLGVLDVPQQLMGMHEFEPEPMPYAHAYTDSNGAFELSHLSVGPHTVRASHAEYASAWVEVPSVGEGEPQDIGTFQLTQGGTLVGRVERRDGLPLAGAVIVASRSDQQGTTGIIDYGMAVTEADGTYSIPHLAQALYVVLNVADDSAPPAEWSRLQQVQVRTGQTTRVDFLSEAQDRSVRGFLLHSDGEPIAEWFLTLALEDRRGGFLDWSATGTGPDGSFELVGIDAGVHGLFLGRRANDSFIRCGTLEVPTHGTREYTIRLANTEIAGTLIDSRTDRPVIGDVVLERFDPDRSAWTFAGRDLRAEGGSFQFPFLEPGSYRVTAVDVPGLATTVSDPLLIEPGMHLRSDLRLVPGGKVIVHCRDEAGRPVRGARLDLTLDGLSLKNDLPSRDSHWIADREGTIVIEHLPLSTLTGAIAAPGHSGARESVTPTVEGTLWEVVLPVATD